MSWVQQRLHESSVDSLSRPLASPPFSSFHANFRPGGAGTPEGNLRKAFFLAYDETASESLLLGEARERVRS